MESGTYFAGSSLQLQYDSARGLPVNKTERGDGSGVFIRCLCGCEADSCPRVILQEQGETDGHGAKGARRPEFMVCFAGREPVCLAGLPVLCLIK